MEQVKSVLEHIHSISCMAIAAEVRISTASVCCILTSSLGKRKVWAKWIPHVLSDNQTAMHVHLATTHLHCWRNEGSVFHECILTVDESWMQSFDPHMKQQNAEWCARMSPKKKIAWSSQGTSYSLAEMDLCFTIPCQFVQHSASSITVHDCRIFEAGSSL